MNVEIAGFDRHRTPSTGGRCEAWRSDAGLELPQFAKRKFPGLNVVMVSGRDAPYVPQDARFLMSLSASGLLDA